MTSDDLIESNYRVPLLFYPNLISLVTAAPHAVGPFISQYSSVSRQNETEPIKVYMGPSIKYVTLEG